MKRDGRLSTSRSAHVHGAAIPSGHRVDGFEFKCRLSVVRRGQWCNHDHVSLVSLVGVLE